MKQRQHKFGEFRIPRRVRVNGFDEWEPDFVIGEPKERSGDCNTVSRYVARLR